MSNSEKSNEAVDGAKKALSGGLASIMALKSSNPKVFMGGAAALLLLFILMLTMGGDDKPAVIAAGGAPAKNLTVGQKYVLHSPNSYDDKAVVQLVPVPGTIAAFDEAEDEVKNSCRKILQGTHVSVMGFQDAYGKKDAFAQVKVEEGACKDKDGWVLAVDLQ
ncbi:MAG: hypothetical protein HOP02_10870 [Methylococcaceae bacterium]|nr:hypothetical protein [Methylococcaceae bacterium]